MRTTRHIIAVTLVATALCADRVAMASAQLREPSPGIARQLANRLTVTFRRVVPTVTIHQVRREGMAPGWPVVLLTATPVLVHPVESSPFQFRLPPPTT